MFTFMFGVLGSLIFWAIYLPVSLVISLFILKRLGPFGKYVADTFISKGESNSTRKFVSLMALIAIVLLWPIVTFVYILTKLFFNMVVWNAITKLINKVETITPEVKITFSKEEIKS